MMMLRILVPHGHARPPPGSQHLPLESASWSAGEEVQRSWLRGPRCVRGQRQQQVCLMWRGQASGFLFLCDPAACNITLADFRGHAQEEASLLHVNDWVHESVASVLAHQIHRFNITKTYQRGLYEHKSKHAQFCIKGATTYTLTRQNGPNLASH